jgi:ATP-binding cassette subfamily C protein CydCD
MKLDPRLLKLALLGKGILGAGILLGLSGGLLVLWQARLLSEIIQDVFLQGAGRDSVIHLLTLLGFVILGRGIISYGMEFSSARLAIVIKRNLREKIFHRIAQSEMAFLSNEQTGELAGVITEGVEEIDSYFSQYLPQLALAVLLPPLFLIFIFPIDVLSGMIMLLTAPLIPLFMVLIGNMAEKVTQSKWESLRRMSAFFLDIIQGLPTLKNLGRSQDMVGEIKWISGEHRRLTMQVLRVAFMSALVLELVATLSTAVVAVQIGLRLLYGWVDFINAFFILLIAPEFYSPLRSLGARFHAGMAGVSAGKRIFEILDNTSREFQDCAETQNGSVAITSSEQIIPFDFNHIHFEGVHFAYQEGEPLIDNVSITIEKRKKYALVGASGAGKTTLAYLLMSFITPTRGRITVDGVVLNEIEPNRWREMIAWSPQQPYLFNASIFENIILAKPDASWGEVIRAAQMARADEFIQNMPLGYHTIIGETGARLSAGQAQRIALARAFLKDAPILILDEGTAHLDTFTEIDLLDSLKMLSHNRTVLMIAHRLNTVKEVDNILVLDEGKLVEQGAHEDLLARRGKYADLIAAGTLEDTTWLDRLSEGERIKETVSKYRQPYVNSDHCDEKAIHSTDEIESMVGSDNLSQFAVLQKLLSFLRPHSVWILMSIFLGFAAIGSSMGLMGAAAYIISMAAIGSSIATFQLAIVGVRFFGISRGLSRYLERYLTHQTTFIILERMRVWFYQVFARRSLISISGFKSGDLLARIVSDIAILEYFFVRAISPPLVAILVTCIAGIYLASFQPLLGLIFVLFMTLAAIFLPVLVRVLAKTTGEKLVREKAHIMGSIVDIVQGIADLRIYGQIHKRVQLANEAITKFGKLQIRMAGINSMQNVFGVLVPNMCVWLLLYLTVPYIQRGEISGVYLAVILLVALTAFEAALPLPLAAQHLGSNLQAGKRLFGVANVVKIIDDPIQPLNIPSRLDMQIVEISFGYSGEVPRMDSRYQSGQSFKLDKISVNIPFGKHIAIVGESGSGKTTLINLLLRLLVVDEGVILLNGKPLGLYDGEEFRRKMGYVQQNPYLFNATMADNILIAKPDATKDELELACIKAGLKKWIRGSSRGLGTWIGEHGEKLSGGERQRVAIARALIKDAPILILDEPTANLDWQTEASIMQTIFKETNERTLILVTHRLTGMEQMNEILLLRDGRVVERGNHITLMKRGEAYYRTWSMQAR